MTTSVIIGDLKEYKLKSDCKPKSELKLEKNIDFAIEKFNDKSKERKGNG